MREAGVAVEFQSQTFKVKRNCGRENVKKKKMGGADWNQASGSMGPRNGSPVDDMGKEKKWGVISGGGRQAGRVQRRPPTRYPRTGIGWFVIPPPEAIAVQDPPTPSVQLQSSSSVSVQPQLPVPSFDEKCTPSQAPVVDHGRFDHLWYGQIHELRKRRRYNGTNSKEVLGSMRLIPGLRTDFALARVTARRRVFARASRASREPWAPRPYGWVQGGRVCRRHMLR